MSMRNSQKFLYSIYLGLEIMAHRRYVNIQFYEIMPNWFSMPIHALTSNTWDPATPHPLYLVLTVYFSHLSGYKVVFHLSPLRNFLIITKLNILSYTCLTTCVSLSAKCLILSHLAFINMLFIKHLWNKSCVNYVYCTHLLIYNLVFHFLNLAWWIKVLIF